jgi:hypothetical protein
VIGSASKVLEKNDFFQKIKKGFKDITPQQQLQANYISSVGQSFGFMCAGIAMILHQVFIEYTWTKTFFIIVIVFATMQTFTQARAMKKQLDEIKEAEEDKDALAALLNARG